MNKVILMGRLTKDPEQRQTQSGVTAVRFTIAVNRRFKDKTTGEYTADFISCTAWRQTAEFICKYFHKGDMIAAVGSIQTRSWDGADGKKQYATDVVIDEAYFTGAKSETQTQTRTAVPSVKDVPHDYSGMPDAADMPDETVFEQMGFSAEEGNEEDLPF